MKLNRLFVIILIAFSGCIVSKNNAPFVHPVTWQHSAKKINDSTFIVNMKAGIKPGWHVYSQALENDEGPLPTIFTYNFPEGLRLIDSTQEPKSITHYDSNFEMNLNYFENEVEFTQKVEARKTKTKFIGNINYMVCNEETCLPPTDEVVEVILK